MRVILNASNIGAAGPEVVIRDLVPALAALAPDDHFTLLLPDTLRDRSWGLPANCETEFLKRYRIREIGRLWDLQHTIPSYCARTAADACITLGDLGPIRLPIPHIIFLHQPYLLCDDKALTRSFPPLERVKLWYQRHHFARSLRHAAAVIVQTPVMLDALNRRHALRPELIHLIPPALPRHVSLLQQPGKGGRDRLADRGAGIRLLFLSAFYAHKNHRILPAVAQEIVRRGLEGSVHIYVTLDESRNRAVGALLREMKCFPSVLTNLGRLPAEDVGPTLRSASALFLPTLAETFGLPYIEALALGVPVLTSDRDFARYICGDAAMYFDPLDAMSIVDAVEKFIANIDHQRSRVAQRSAAALSSCSSTVEATATGFLRVLQLAVREPANRRVSTT